MPPSFAWRRPPIPINTLTFRDTFLGRVVTGNAQAFPVVPTARVRQFMNDSLSHTLSCCWHLAPLNLFLGIKSKKPPVIRELKFSGGELRDGKHSRLRFLLGLLAILPALVAADDVNLLTLPQHTHPEQFVMDDHRCFAACLDARQRNRGWTSRLHWGPRRIRSRGTRATRPDKGENRGGAHATYNPSEQDFSWYGHALLSECLA
jgi:hypothetical protein